MSVIIRLQGLPLSAASVDVRRYFNTLNIPDGGVHIIGGEKGDAFIAFSSDEDARLAMQRNDGYIHDARVKLLLSSKTEMQNVIAEARGQIPAADPSYTTSQTTAPTINVHSNANFNTGSLSTSYAGVEQNTWFPGTYQSVPFSHENSTGSMLGTTIVRPQMLPMNQIRPSYGQSSYDASSALLYHPDSHIPVAGASVQEQLYLQQADSNSSQFKLALPSQKDLDALQSGQALNRNLDSGRPESAQHLETRVSDRNMNIPSSDWAVESNVSSLYGEIHPEQIHSDSYGQFDATNTAVHNQLPGGQGDIPLGRGIDSKQPPVAAIDKMTQDIQGGIGSIDRHSDRALAGKEVSQLQNDVKIVPLAGNTNDRPTDRYVGDSHPGRPTGEAHSWVNDVGSTGGQMGKAPGAYVDNEHYSGHMEDGRLARQMPGGPPPSYVEGVHMTGHMEGSRDRHMDAEPQSRKIENEKSGRNIEERQPYRHMEVGPQEMHTDGRTPGGHIDRRPAGRHMNREPPSRYMDGGPPGRLMDGGPPNNRMDRPPDRNRERQQPNRNMDGEPIHPIGQRVDSAALHSQREPRSVGRQMEGRHSDRHAEYERPVRSMEELQGKHIKSGSADRHIDRPIAGPPDKHIERGAPDRHMEGVPPSKHIDRETSRQPGMQTEGHLRDRHAEGGPPYRAEYQSTGRGMERAPGEQMVTRPPGRYVEGAPRARHMESVPPGRHMEVRPPGRHMESGAPGRHIESGPPGRHMEGGPPGMQREGGPPVRRLEGAEPGRHMEGGPRGRRVEGVSPGKHMDGVPLGRQMEGAPPGRPMEGAQPGRQMGRGRPPGRQMEGAPPGRQMGRGGPPGRHIEGVQPVRHIEAGPPGRHMEGTPPGRPMGRGGPPVRHMESGPPGRHMEGGPQHRHVEGGTPGMHAEAGPPTRHIEAGPPGRHVGGGPSGRHMDGGLPGRHMEGGLPGRHVGGGPPGRHMDGGPPDRHMEGGPPGRLMDGGPPDRHMEERIARGMDHPQDRYMGNEPPERQMHHSQSDSHTEVRLGGLLGDAPPGMQPIMHLQTGPPGEMRDSSHDPEHPHAGPNGLADNTGRRDSLERMTRHSDDRARELAQDKTSRDERYSRDGERYRSGYDHAGRNRDNDRSRESYRRSDNRREKVLSRSHSRDRSSRDRSPRDRFGRSDSHRRSGDRASRDQSGYHREPIPVNDGKPGRDDSGVDALTKSTDVDRQQKDKFSKKQSVDVRSSTVSKDLPKGQDSTKQTSPLKPIQQKTSIIDVNVATAKTMQSIPNKHEPLKSPILAEQANKQPTVEEEKERSIQKAKTTTQNLALYMHVTNMPKTVSYSQIRRFFGGAVIPKDGIKMINNKLGQRIGEAYLKFSKQGTPGHALRKNGQYMEENRIKVTSCTFEEFDKAIDSYLPDSDSEEESPPTKRMRSVSSEEVSIENPKSAGMPKDTRRFCVMLRGLPANITEKMIHDFLGRDVRLTENSSYIDYSPDSNQTGIAFIEVSRLSDYKNCMAKHRGKISGCPIEVFAATTDDLDKAKQKTHARNESQTPASPTREESIITDSNAKSAPTLIPTEESKPSFNYSCVKLQGLPFDTTRKHIEEFFSGLRIDPRGVHIIYNKNGHAIGDAFVEFVTFTDCQEALKKDRDYMGKRYVTVTPISKTDLLEQLRKSRMKVSESNIKSLDTNITNVASKPIISTPDVPAVLSTTISPRIGTHTSPPRAAISPRGSPRPSINPHVSPRPPVSQHASPHLSSSPHMPNPTVPNSHMPSPAVPNTHVPIPAVPNNHMSSPPAPNLCMLSPVLPSTCMPNLAVPNTRMPGPAAPNTIVSIGPCAPMVQMAIPSAPPQSTLGNITGGLRLPAVPSKPYLIGAKGLPHNTTIGELLTFFRGYNPIPSTIRFHYSSDGRPTGDALVGFVSESEGKKVCRELKDKVLNRQPIRLFLAEQLNLH